MENNRHIKQQMEEVIWNIIMMKTLGTHRISFKKLPLSVSYF